MAPVKIPEKQLNELRTFVTLIKAQPVILQQPEFHFFKEYIESLGGTVPVVVEPTEPPRGCPAGAHSHADPKPAAPAAEEPEEAEEVESDVELDQAGVVEPDNDPPQEMGNPDVEMKEEDEEKVMEMKQEAVAAFADGDFEKAMRCYTEVIKMNPNSALMFAKRANCYIHLNKPNACIRDCDRALELNPDSATARKFRGRANRLLGKWEEAAVDLRLACKLDYDDQASEWLKEVTPNAKKLEDHRRKYERLREEKLVREKKERLRKAQEEHKKAREREASSGYAGGANPFGGMGGMGGMPGMGGAMPDLSSLLNDPEVLAAFQDPEVAAAFAEVSSDPSKFAKYENNPKIRNVIKKMSAKFGGGMGGAGGFSMPPGGGGFANPTDDGDLD